MFGTPYYQAPEQLAKEGAWFSTKIDCWALGIVFFTILEGRHPFKSLGEEVNEREFKRRVLKESPTFTRTSNLKYVHLVTKLLEKVGSDLFRILKLVSAPKKLLSIYSKKNQSADRILPE